MQFTYSIIDFQLFYDGAVHTNMSPSDKKLQCNVSDTQVAGKACGPLVISRFNLMILIYKLWSLLNGNCYQVKS